MNSYSFSLAAEPQVLSMIALSQENLIQNNSKGALDFMLKDLSKLSGIPHQYTVTSIKRGKRKFRNKRVACVIPSVVGQSEFKSLNVIHSVPFAQLENHAFTLPSQAVIQEEVQLHGRLIGVLKGSPMLDSPFYTQLIAQQL